LDGDNGPKMRQSVDEVLAEIVKRITPAVLDMYAKRENGEIKLRFQSGDLRGAVRTEVAL